MSWERRMEQWKSLPKDDKSVDAWFESLSPMEREDAFFESKSFQILTEELLDSIRNRKTLENKKRLRERLKHLPWKELDASLMKKYLMNIVVRTPSLFASVHENKNVAPDIALIRPILEDRLYTIIGYEASGGQISSDAYNLGQVWEPPLIENQT